MIIEGAFFKLPEILLSHYSIERQYEATLTNHLSMAVLLELNARNIDMPMNRISQETPYKKYSGEPISLRSDLYINLQGIYGESLYDKAMQKYEHYGMKSHNWLEAKYFAGYDTTRGEQAKTENSASVAFDLFRLCLLVTESEGDERKNGRYAVVLFDKHPKFYLPYIDQSNCPTERRWLNDMLLGGNKRVEIDLREQPRTFRSVFGKGFRNQENNLVLRLDIDMHSFIPNKPNSDTLYWGYLIRIIDFEVQLDDQLLEYKDIGQEYWTAENVNIQGEMLEKYLQIR